MKDTTLKPTAEKAVSLRAGGKAVIVQHCAVFGRLETQVRKWSVSPPLPYAQYPVVVSVRFCKPRRRRGLYITVGEREFNLRAHE